MRVARQYTAHRDVTDDAVVQPVASRLVKRVETDWRRVGYAQRDFPSIAANALQVVAPHENLDTLAAIRSIAAGEARDVFVGVHGCPQIVPLFVGPRFSIAMHLWQDNVQTPHSHAWSGAYQVLFGTSVHGLFSFAEDSRYDAKFLLGTLTLDRFELLDPGATVPVVRGGRTIHGMNYIGRFGVAISIRTTENQPAMTHDFLAPGVAIQGSHTDRVTQQRFRSLAALYALDPERAFEALTVLLGAADPRSCFWLLRYAAVHFRQGLDVERLFELSASKFGAYAPTVKRAVETWEREEVLRRRRKAIRAADHRFLLAVLHLARDRADIERMVAARHTEAPSAFVLRCLTEMASTSSEPGWTLLGTPSTSDFGSVLALLLQDESTASVLQRLEGEYDAESVREMAPLVREACEALRTLPLLWPLFPPQRPSGAVR